MIEKRKKNRKKKKHFESRLKYVKGKIEWNNKKKKVGYEEVKKKTTKEKTKKKKYKENERRKEGRKSGYNQEKEWKMEGRERRIKENEVTTKSVWRVVKEGNGGK